MHTVIATRANEADVEQIADLLHGREQQVWADSGYRGAHKRVDRESLQWHIAARPSDVDAKLVTIVEFTIRCAVTALGKL